jgi:hypothetical protein
MYHYSKKKNQTNLYLMHLQLRLLVQLSLDLFSAFAPPSLLVA